MVIFITGCTSTGIIDKNINIATIKVQGDLCRNINIPVLKFEYEGHNYICFKPYRIDSSSIVHDPDCPCLKK